MRRSFPHAGPTPTEELRDCISEGGVPSQLKLAPPSRRVVEEYQADDVLAMSNDSAERADLASPLLQCYRDHVHHSDVADEELQLEIRGQIEEEPSPKSSAGCCCGSAAALAGHGHPVDAAGRSNEEED